MVFALNNCGLPNQNIQASRSSSSTRTVRGEKGSPGSQGRRGGRGSDGDKGDDGRDYNNRLYEIPEVCSGSSCCEGSDDCEDKCDKWFKGRAEKECLKTDQDIINDIDQAFTIFTDPTGDPLGNGDDLDDITNFDALFWALDKLDKSGWLWTTINGYDQNPTILSRGRSNNIAVLKWIIENDRATDILYVTDNSNSDAENIVLEFLTVAPAPSIGFGTTPQKYLDKLSADIQWATGVTKPALEYALDENNEDFITWIHDHFVEEKICVSASRPTCAGTPTAVDGVTPTKCTTPPADSFAACKLAVYCKIFPHTPSSKATARAKLASYIRSNKIKSLIRNDQGGTTHGLELTETDAEQWTDKACKYLQSLWADGSLTLGL